MWNELPIQCVLDSNNHIYLAFPTTTFNIKQHYNSTMLDVNCADTIVAILFISIKKVTVNILQKHTMMVMLSMCCLSSILLKVNDNEWSFNIAKKVKYHQVYQLAIWTNSSLPLKCSTFDNVSSCWGVEGLREGTQIGY